MSGQIPFECADYSVEGLQLSFLDSEGTKPPLHFYHANGFPVSMYMPWMTDLARDFRVMGLSLRGQDGLSLLGRGPSPPIAAVGIRVV